MKNRTFNQPAIWISIALHIALLWIISDLFPNGYPQKKAFEVIEIKMAPEKEKSKKQAVKEIPTQTVATTQADKKEPAYMDAPPAPSAQEWAMAGKYTLKNSKRYRHTWGQQVRSQMGRAVEGPDQGMVRFHIEIAANGKLSKLETLWSTSEVAEKLARKAIENMPPLPPIPTGKPLIFQKTISFQPVDNGWPPIYKYDCLPDPPSFKNPFAWDGQSSPTIKQENLKVAQSEPIADCPTDLMEDSIEAEAADMQRQFEEWSSSKLKTQKQ